jgi:SAM-dependent methyltransferase
VTRTPYTSCPLCAGSFSPDREVDGIAWVRCDACGHSFTAGYFEGEALRELLARPVHGQQVGFMHEDLRLPCSRMVERVAQHVSHGYWLDVGFGNGALLFAAEEFGYLTVGCDIRPELVSQMHAIGMEAELGEIGSVREGVSIVSMCDVLEHMPDPKAALQHAYRLLREVRGALLISCPNADAPSFQFHTSAGTNPYWGEVEHFHNFGRARLYALLRECGFEPVSYAVSERYRLCMEVIARPV